LEQIKGGIHSQDGNIASPGLHDHVMGMILLVHRNHTDGRRNVGNLHDGIDDTSVISPVSVCGQDIKSITHFEQCCVIHAFLFSHETAQDSTEMGNRCQEGTFVCRQVSSPVARYVTTSLVSSDFHKPSGQLDVPYLDSNNCNKASLRAWFGSFLMICCSGHLPTLGKLTGITVVPPVVSGGVNGGTVPAVGPIGVTGGVAHTSAFHTQPRSLHACATLAIDTQYAASRT
jgi:hypothetical protein